VFTDDADEKQRYGIFQESLKRIEAGNALGDKVFGLTWTSDRLEHEKHGKGFKRPSGFKATAPVYEKKSPLMNVAAIIGGPLMP